MDLTQQQLALCQYSLLSEPGDQLAGIILEELGAEAALRDLVQNKAKALWPAIFRKLSLDEYLLSLLDTIERFQLRLANYDVEQILEKSIRNQIFPIFEIPPGLQDLGFAKPIILWGKGNSDLLRDPAVAVVGSRNPSLSGLQTTKELVQRIPNQFAVVSGGALGIDAMAHQTALAKSQPTLCFMAGGLLRTYPRQNQQLFEQIACHGLLVSEMFCDVAPTRWRFLQRNRLIAAQANFTVVVEAASRSGTRNTVGHANALGRSVLAIPGDINNPSSHGCNALIAEGLASPISSIESFAKIFKDTSPESFELNDNQKRTLDAIGKYPKSKDSLCLESGLSTKELSLALQQLVKQRMVYATPLGYLKEYRQG